MKLFTVKEDIELDVLNRKKLFKKDEPYIFDTFIKVYGDLFVPYVPKEIIKEKIFDMNKNYANNKIETLLENTEIFVEEVE
jgi:hypothetical protein